MNTPPLLTSLPTGVAFELADLFMVQGWSEYHNLRMIIELDYAAEGEEYEEVLALYPRNSGFRRWTMWRGTGEIAVQPIMGRVMRFQCVADALECLIPTRA